MSALITFALTLAIGSHSLAQDRFGAELRAVNEAAARSLSGYAASGVAIEKIQPSGLAERFDLAINDVILEVNGTRTLQPSDVIGAIRSVTDGNCITYSRRSRKWIKTVVAEWPVKVAFLVSPEVADDRENEWIDFGRAAGVAPDVIAKLPSDLSRYAAIVIIGTKARAELVAKLPEYLRKGGGVVLVGMAPRELGNTNEADNRIARIASWFGAPEFTESSIYGEDRGNLTVNVNNPVGAKLRSGDQLFGYVSRPDLPIVWENHLAETAGVIARFGFADSGDLGRGVGAFTNRYGDGRVYWQSIASSPSHPRLQELLVAGIRWAAAIGD